jgi:ATP-dependent Lon protease
MNGLHASFELRGLGKQWKSASPGTIAKCFRDSTVANPIFLLDEIDKGPKSGDSWGRPLDTFLEMMEETTAKTFRDNCLECEFDVSHALYVATANDINALPGPIVSRFIVAEISAPTIDQMASVIDSIFKDLVAKEGDIYDSTLPEDIIASLRHSTPREAKHLLSCAISAAAARAVRAGHSSCKPIKIESGDLPRPLKKRHHPIGFAPS